MTAFDWLLIALFYFGIGNVLLCRQYSRVGPVDDDRRWFRIAVYATIIIAWPPFFYLRARKGLSV